MKEVKVHRHPRFSASGQKMVEALELLLGCKLKITYLPEKTVVYKQVEAAVLEEYGITAEALFAPGRKQPIAEARQVMMYMMRTYLEMQDKEIAAHFGKNRTGVIHSFRRIRDLVSIDDSVKKKIENCLIKIESYEPQ